MSIWNIVGDGIDTWLLLDMVTNSWSPEGGLSYLDEFQIGGCVIGCCDWEEDVSFKEHRGMGITWLTSRGGVVGEGNDERE